MKMGFGTGSRTHYRPLAGGFSRSPSFLVAALTIGFFIIAFSYWRLAIQYHDLEKELRQLVQRRNSLEESRNTINKQLEQRENNFSEAKVSLQKKEQQVEELQKKITETEKELKEIRVNVDSMKQSNEKLKAEVAEKERSVDLIRAQNKKLEEEKTKLEEELKKTKDNSVNVRPAPKPEQAAGEQASGQNAQGPKPVVEALFPKLSPKFQAGSENPQKPDPSPKQSSAPDNQVQSPVIEGDKKADLKRITVRREASYVEDKVHDL